MRKQNRSLQVKVPTLRTDVETVHVDAYNQDQSKPYILKPGERDFNFAGAYDGIYAPSLRYPQFNLDKLLSEKGYQYVDDMLYMAACRSPFDLKRYAVLQDGWDVLPAEADPAHPKHEYAKMLADSVRYALQNIRDYETDYTQDLVAVLFDLMHGAWDGNQVMEIDWQYCDFGKLKGMQTFRGFYSKPNKQMAFDVDVRTMALKNFTSYTPGGGYDFQIPVEKCLYYVHNQSSNLPSGNGDWRACHKHWKRLDANLMIWAMALERWGSPVLVAQYPGGSPTELAAARAAMDSIRQGAAALIPDNVKYQIVTAPQQVFLGFEAACRYDAEQIAINVVGNTLTTGAGENSLALGQVHQKSGATYDDALSERICNTFGQQVIRRYIRYNFGEDACEFLPKLRLKERLENDQLKLAQMLQILIESGNMPSKSAVIRNTLNLPAISPEESTLLEAERKAIAEAQAQIADGKNPDKVMKMAAADGYTYDDVVKMASAIIYHTTTMPQARAKLAGLQEAMTPMELRAIEGRS